MAETRANSNAELRAKVLVLEQEKANLLAQVDTWKGKHFLIEF